jgi:hypothetical protein
MAVKQVAASYQNDGNFSQLDLVDPDFRGPLMRIETFRASHPGDGDYSVTEAGTPAAALIGRDHLTPHSNRIFRNLFSVGSPTSMSATLEIRESYDENGGWEVRARDLAPDSPSFGEVVVCHVEPSADGYRIQYEFFTPGPVARGIVPSPLRRPVTDLVPAFADLASPVNQLGAVDSRVPTVNAVIPYTAKSRDLDDAMEHLATRLQQEPFHIWAHNVRQYERFGDFRDKCVHDGTNLVGENPQLASEYLLIRAYRASLISLGRIFDLDMKYGATALWDHNRPLAVDPKPGVYLPFLSAYILNIGIYQLGLDKVHSDYGGIPMKLRPGSRLENGAAHPVVADARRANQTLAELARLFYTLPVEVPTPLHRPSLGN